MPVVRKLVAATEGDDNQFIKVDFSGRYIYNHSPEWQPIFGPNSALTPSAQVVRIGAEFNKDSLDSLFLTAYLYNPTTGNVDSAASCSFRVYLVSNPNWSDSLQLVTAGSALPNQHFYTEIPLTSLPGVNLEGGDTLLVEAVIVRSGVTYRDRRYINHLGSWDSIVRLRGDVEFLDITKLDE